MRLVKEPIRTLLLVVIAAITAWGGYLCLDLEVDQSNGSMQSDDQAQEEVEREFRESFGEEETLLVAVSVEGSPSGSVLSEAGRDVLRALDRDLEAIDGIREAVSLADRGFDPNRLGGSLLSADGRTAGIRVLVEEAATEGDSLPTLVESIYETIDRHASEDVRIAVSGLALQTYHAGVLVRKDQGLFAPLCLLVLGAVLFWITRRISGMLFPLLVSVLTICWTLGIYAWCGHELNMITSLLPPVIMTLSVACTIHVYLHWLHSEEPDQRRRIGNAVRALYRPCLFAALTTAIGFLSLTISATPAVRLFGLFAALGVGIAYVLGVFGLALGLSFVKPPLRHRRDFADSNVLARSLDRVAETSLRHPRKTIAISLLVAVIGVLGIREVESDTNLLHFLGEDSRLHRDTLFIEKNLVGTSQLELILDHQGDDVFAEEDLERIEAFEEELRSLAAVREVVGLPELLAEAPLPPGALALGMADVLARPEFGSYVDEASRFRVTVLLDSIGTAEGSEVIDRVREIAVETLGETFTVRETGTFFRVVEDSNFLVTTQVKSFLLAIGVIVLAIGIVFRSAWFACLSVIPNVVPLLVTGGIMGWFGISLSTGTVMIASVAIGIAVDGTIHYLSGFRSQPGEEPAAAIRRTTRTTGLALFATTLALSAGFWVAVFGSFRPTIYFALLSGLTMWFALICDLLVLPALLNRKRSPAPTEPT